MNIRSHISLVLALFFSALSLSGCGAQAHKAPLAPGTAMLSLSSNGHYAISSQFDGRIILWDLVDHTHKLIAQKANIYSVYYIKHSPFFMWQSLSSHQPTYLSLVGPPSLQQLQAVKLGAALYITHENGHPFKEDGGFYLYFFDKENHAGYMRQRIKLAYAAKKFIDKLEGPENAFYGKPGSAAHLISSIDLRLEIEQLAIQAGYKSDSLVHVQDPSGHEALRFNNFPVYGQVMTADFKTYLASDFNWNLFEGYGSAQKQLMLDQGGFYFGKLLNLTLSSNGRYLITSGVGSGYNIEKLFTGQNMLAANVASLKYGLRSYMEGVVLWNTQTGQPMHKYPGVNVLTYATISPDAQYIVAGDSNEGSAFEWNALTAKMKFKLWDIFYGKTIGWNKKNGEAIKWTTRGLMAVPKGYTSFMYQSEDVRDNKMAADEKLLAFKFIDSTHYLRFNYYVPYAILYSVNDPRPLKYFPLGMKPIPAVNNYAQDESLDTSPSAHVLVVAQAGNHAGIIEYKYDLATKALKKVWVGHASSAIHY